MSCAASRRRIAGEKQVLTRQRMSAPADDVDNSRRAFLRGAFLTRKGREGDEQQHPLGPAPPWHQGCLDTERCQTCEAPCVDACGLGIIKRHPNKEHLFAGQPYLDFTESGCTFCGDCVTACPMELDKTTTPAKLGQVKLETPLCLAWNDVFCMSCRSHCDHGALSFDQRRRVQLNTEACTGCGRCLSVCPTQALSFQHVARTSIDPK